MEKVNVMGLEGIKKVRDKGMPREAGGQLESF